MNKLLALIVLSMSTLIFASQPAPAQLAANTAAPAIPAASQVKSSAVDSSKDQKQNNEGQTQHTILYAIREGTARVLHKTNVLLERHAGVEETADLIFLGCAANTQIREIVIHNKTTGSFIKKVSAAAILIAPHYKVSEDLSSILDTVEKRFESHMKKGYIPGTILTGKYCPQKKEFTAVSIDD